MARELIKYASLFKDRHYFPDYVKDFVFDGMQKGYDPMNMSTFRTEALEKFIQWKHHGFTSAHIYMSGLTTAAVEIINAAFLTGLPIRLFHYSFLQDKWLPQDIDAFTSIGYNISRTSREAQMWNTESQLKSELTKAEYINIVGYVRIYKDLLLKYRDKEDEIPEWPELKKELYRTFRDIQSPMLELMATHLYPIKHLVEGRTFNERIREEIIKRRGEERPTSTGYDGLARGSCGKYKTSTGKAPRPIHKGRTYKRENNRRVF